MSWNNLDIKNADAEKIAKESRSKQAELAKDYHRCFNTDEGKRVLQDLTQRFIYNNDTQLASPNINYEAAYHNGEKGVLKFIVHVMTSAREL